MQIMTLKCPKCLKSIEILRDENTGLWELPKRYSSISNLSWQYLEKVWLKGHNQACEKEPKTRFNDQIKTQLRNWVKKFAFYREPI
jgi:hypothetical protein